MIIRDPQLIQKIALRLPLGKLGRIKAAWQHEQSPVIGWGAIPTIQQRMNLLVSGDEKIDYCEYISSKYLAGKNSLRGLSLSCGSGENELRWAQTNKFSRIDACDLSENRIQHAKIMANDEGFGDILNFYIGDVFNIKKKDPIYDVVLCSSSLHHFSPLEHILQIVINILKPGGIFVVNEFVGPTRFQWTDRQIELINSLLAIFPFQYKTLTNSHFTKLPIVRPSKFGMILRDPSEAVESSNILPMLYRRFDVIERRDLGGTILHPLLYRISHHFLYPDETGSRLLKLCIEVEDILLTTREIESDFTLVVCRAKS
jgi:ubiquinone/menaquinone biosynthesis C-methylase UbiE